jgi:hypothetical protein
MAYVNQATKTTIAPKIKAICAKYKVKGSLSIRHHSTLVLTIKSGAIDFIGNGNVTCGQANTSGYEQINPYHYGSHYSGKAKKFLQEVLAEMNAGNHDNSNAQIDYFDVGWYVDVNIGKWNQPYALSV